MDLTELLKNPIMLLALFSLVAFPFGLLLLGFTAKKLGVGGLVDVMTKHVAVEVKIEERLQELVSETKSLFQTFTATNWDNRRYYDDKFDHFDTRFDLLEKTIERMIEALPKRKGD